METIASAYLVDPSRVEEVDAELEGLADGAQGFLLGGGAVEVLRVDRREDVLQFPLALASLQDALGQPCAGVGFQQIGVQGRLCGLGNLGVRRLGRDHDKDGVERQQLIAAQVVQQVLPRSGFFFEGLLADDDVVLRRLQFAPGIRQARALGDLAQAQFPQL